MNTAFYASGAYLRERFDKPLSRYPIYTAMISSAAAENRWFDLGDVSLSPRTPDKERSNSYFKRGFSSYLKASLLWRWRVPADVPAKRAAGWALAASKSRRDLAVHCQFTIVLDSPAVCHGFQ